VTFTEIFNEKAREHALAEGRLEGEVKRHVAVLLKLLNRKFGDLPPAVRDRVTGATEVELDRWTDNILSAATIDDVFGQ
jgi:hypothetical protein